MKLAAPSGLAFHLSDCFHIGLIAWTESMFNSTNLPLPCLVSFHTVGAGQLNHAVMSRKFKPALIQF